MSFVTSAELGRAACRRPRFAAWEECHGCAGGPSTTRGFAYNTRMNRLFDKSIVLACCIAAAMGLAVDARLVAAFCLGVIATSLAEVVQGNRARRVSEAASYACIIAAVFVPPFVPFAPLALYDIARRVRRERIWPALAIGAVFVCALVADLRGGVLTTRTLLLTAILSVAATLLSLRTAQLEREQRRMRRTRDELQERALALEARNRDLADRLHGEKDDHRQYHSDPIRVQHTQGLCGQWDSCQGRKQPPGSKTAKRTKKCRCLETAI